MQTHQGDLDRTFRIGAGLALIALAVTNTVDPWAWIGVVPLLTGLAGPCPLDSMLRFDTRPGRRC